MTLLHSVRTIDRCMSPKRSELPISLPGSTSIPTDDEPTFSRYDGPAVLSYGFRPFFLGAALFAGGAIPIWVLAWVGTIDGMFLYPSREWHVHEMLFGFLPAVMTGFLLTAVPNWTGRVPLRGMPLLCLFLLWLAGRLLMAWPWPTPFIAALVDASFFFAVAALLWRELISARTWAQAPIAVLISLYAVSNCLFHAMALSHRSTAFSERVVLSLLVLLLVLIGGRLTPTFTGELLQRCGRGILPAAFSWVDGLAIALAVVACSTWIVLPEHSFTGGVFIVAGLMHLVRLSRWHGWWTSREPLVLILHVGYGWVALSLLVLGAALLKVGVQPATAVHVLTAGAVGAMTLAVMTRASLGHTGRARHAGPVTVGIYLLVNIGALLRVLASSTEAPTQFTHVWLGLSAICWSGAYLLFAMSYGRWLLAPSLDE